MAFLTNLVHKVSIFSVGKFRELVNIKMALYDKMVRSYFRTKFMVESSSQFANLQKTSVKPGVVMYTQNLSA